MSIVINDPILKQDIIDRFNTRVRDWVTANTNWVAGTYVWNTSVGHVVANSTNGQTGSTNLGGPPSDGTYPGYIGGGDYNRTAFSTTQPASIAPVDFSAEIGAQPLTMGHVVNVMRNFMVLYANNHRVELMNTGNLATNGTRTSFGTIPYNGVVRLSDVVPAVKTNVLNDMNAAAVNRDVESGEVIVATGIINFIEDCRNIWTVRCFNPTVEQFRYSYCHASCHSNHGSHGSRGRR